MIIENSDALKSWLTGCLEHMCDADPAALAKYVMALVKKDKNEKELKEICLDQLDVFLQKETKPFVDMLFETLSNKSYLQGKPYVPVVGAAAPLPGAVPSSPLQPPPLPPQPSSVALVQQSSVVPSVPPPVLLAVPAHKEGAGGLGAAGLAPAPLPRVAVEASSLPTSAALGGSKPMATAATVATAAAIPVAAATVVPAARKDEVPPAEEDKEQARSSHRKSKSRSRKTNAGPDDASQMTEDVAQRKGGGTMPAADIGETLHAVAGLVMTEQLGQQAHGIGHTAAVGLGHPPGHDHDHLGHAIVREMEANVQRCGAQGRTVRRPILPRQSPVPLTPHMGTLTTDQDSHHPPHQQRYHQMPGRAPPLFMQRPPSAAEITMSVGTACVATTAPLTMAMTLSLWRTCQYCALACRGHPRPRHPTLPCPPQPALPQEPYNPEAPGMGASPESRSATFLGSTTSLPHNQGPPHRELIGVPTVPPSQADLSQPPPPPPPGRSGGPRYGRGGMHGSGGRGRMDYGRGGMNNRAANHYDRCELEVRKVPRALNTITQLNNHFSRFGNIVNLQVCYDGDPEAALIRFSNHAEANAAYRCTEAVLNNRFIKVFWHNKDRNAAPTANGSGSIVPDTSGATAASAGNASMANQPTNGAAAATGTTEAQPAKNIKDRLGAPPVEKSAVFNPIAGNLSRTVFNPAALKKNNVINTGLPKRTKEEQKTEVIKKKVEVQNQRQKLLEKHLQQYKLLLEKLGKCKTEKEREEIKQTIATLQPVIEKLQGDFKKVTNELISSRAPKAGMTTSVVAGLKADVPHGPVGRTQAEKELLDAEMDLYNKMHRGDDTTALRKRVQELRQQARALGLLGGQWKGSSRGGPPGRRGALRGGGRGGGAALRRSLNVIDHRPRKVFVQGMDEGDKENLQAHFAQFGEVEGVELLNSGLVITFKTRKDAELGVSQGSEFKNRPLQWAWFKEPSRTASTSDSASASNLTQDDLAGDDESNLALEEDLLLVDDEEEEDSEARSWRR
ncbi:hypothetical protein MTO96_013040 [Rhipicephalus appendiculatus]